MAEWSKARAWKVRVLQKGTKGSNPFLSAEDCWSTLRLTGCETFPKSKIDNQK